MWQEEHFQVVFGYMKPESAIQWLQRKIHQKAGLVIELKAASCRVKSKVYVSGDLSAPTHLATQQLRAFGHIICTDQLQFPNQWHEGQCEKDPLSTLSKRGLYCIVTEISWESLTVKVMNPTKPLTVGQQKECGEIWGNRDMRSRWLCVSCHHSW